MTRLKDSDICNIPERLELYNEELLVKTGRTLLGIACHSYGKKEIQVKHQAKSFSIRVIPVTSGQGIITDFSEIVSSILKFTGFNAGVSEKPDISGIAQAFEDKVDAIMMADDDKFAGFNLKTRCVADNSDATGRVFASALDLMAQGIKECEALILGCGPVGEAAARKLLSFGAKIALHDISLTAARSLKKRLMLIMPPHDTCRIVIEEEMNTAFPHYNYILEATPSANTIPDNMVSDRMVVATPGVPLGISANGCGILKNRLVHDKLELGVAAMAVCLLSS